MDVIRELLAAGKTPETIYQDALKIVEEDNAAKAAENKRKEKIAEVRSNIIKAYDLYMRAVTDKPLTKEEAEMLTKTLENFESVIAGFGSKKVKPEIKISTSVKDDDFDEVFKNFWKAIGR